LTVVRCPLSVDTNAQFPITNSLFPIPYYQFPMLSKETLFALSLFPYLGFLWFLTKSGKTPRLALMGFYGTLVFVAVTIPAGIYAKVAYNESLANIDWLHGAAESFLTISNILLVLGFREAVIKAKESSPEES
jgi:Protein of unknown function (DUF3593)